MAWGGARGFGLGRRTGLLREGTDRAAAWGGARVGAAARSLRLGEVLRCRGAEAMQGVGRVRGRQTS